MADETKTKSRRFFGLISDETGVSLKLILGLIAIGATMMAVQRAEVRGMRDDLTASIQKSDTTMATKMKEVTDSVARDARELRESLRISTDSLRLAVDKNTSSFNEVATKVAVQGARMDSAVEDIRELKEAVAEMRKEVQAKGK